MANRVTIYALSEVAALDPAGSRKGQANASVSTPSFGPAPLLLPLRVQQELQELCHNNSTCKAAILKGDVPSVWRYDLYDFAMFGCVPYECSRVEDKVLLKYITDGLVLAGGLWSLFFTVLPIMWAVVVMGVLWG